MSCRLLLLLFFTTYSLYSEPLEVEVSAASAVLMNAKTGRVLYEKHPHKPTYPASTTKVATALFVLDQKKPPLDEIVVISPDAMIMKKLDDETKEPAHWLDARGTSMGIRAGEKHTFDALLHGALLCSGNDASNALAVALSGSVPQFVEELNEYLKSLGRATTHFSNPHGLHHSEHFTTAYELALITKKALEFEKFRQIVKSSSYQSPKPGKQKNYELRQFNALVKPGPFFYEKAIGIKTGFTSKAKYTLASAAEYNGRTLIAVLLGCEKKNDRYADAIWLFEAAFSELSETILLFDRNHLFSRQIEGAKSPLHASLVEEIQISDFPAEKPICKAAIIWDPVPLPIQKGAKVGSLQVQDELGNLLIEKDLIATETVSKTILFTLKEWIFH